MYWQTGELLVVYLRVYLLVKMLQSGPFQRSIIKLNLVLKFALLGCSLQIWQISSYNPGLTLACVTRLSITNYREMTSFGLRDRIQCCALGTSWQQLEKGMLTETSTCEKKTCFSLLGLCFIVHSCAVGLSMNYR